MPIGENKSPSVRGSFYSPNPPPLNPDIYIACGLSSLKRARIRISGAAARLETNCRNIFHGNLVVNGVKAGKKGSGGGVVGMEGVVVTAGCIFFFLLFFPRPSLQCLFKKKKKIA